jgi:hypothetical protein
MADMRANFSFSLDNQLGIYTGSGGNPWLRPFRANAIDVAYEKYWGNKAYIGAAAFYKDIKSYVITEGIAFDYTNYVTAQTPPAPNGNVGILTCGQRQGGTISGIELARRCWTCCGAACRFRAGGELLEYRQLAQPARHHRRRPGQDGAAGPVEGSQQHHGLLRERWLPDPRVAAPALRFHR